MGQSCRWGQDSRIRDERKFRDEHRLSLSLSKRVREMVANIWVVREWKIYCFWA